MRGNGRRGPGERVRKGGRESVIEEMGDERKTEEEPVHDRTEGGRCGSGGRVQGEGR